MAFLCFRACISFRTLLYWRSHEVFACGCQQKRLFRRRFRENRPFSQNGARHRFAYNAL
jgi:hypothetical protein